MRLALAASVTGRHSSSAARQRGARRVDTTTRQRRSVQQSSEPVTPPPSKFCGEPAVAADQVDGGQSASAADRRPPRSRGRRRGLKHGERHRGAPGATGKPSQALGRARPPAPQQFLVGHPGETVTATWFGPHRGSIPWQHPATRGRGGHPNHAAGAASSSFRQGQTPTGCVVAIGRRLPDAAARRAMMVGAHAGGSGRRSSPAHLRACRRHAQGRRRGRGRRGGLVRRCRGGCRRRRATTVRMLMTR